MNKDDLQAELHALYAQTCNEAKEYGMGVVGYDEWLAFTFPAPVVDPKDARIAYLEKLVDDLRAYHTCRVIASSRVEEGEPVYTDNGVPPEGQSRIADLEEMHAADAAMNKRLKARIAELGEEHTENIAMRRKIRHAADIIGKAKFYVRTYAFVRKQDEGTILEWLAEAEKELVDDND